MLFCMSLLSYVLRRGSAATIALLLVMVMGIALSCSETKTPVAAAVRHRDSSSVMTTYGVSKLISDSGVIRYKVVAEEWRVYDRTNPPRHSFPKGLLLERFNQKLHVEMYITADTAYWFNQDLWELRGRVKVWQDDGTVFTSNLLYWDMGRHEFSSNVYSHLKTPDREVQGTSFRSDEKMRHYVVNNSRAVFPLPEKALQQNDSLHKAEENEAPIPDAVLPARPTEATSNSASSSSRAASSSSRTSSSSSSGAPSSSRTSSARSPQRATSKPSPNLPPGGHFK